MSTNNDITTATDKEYILLTEIEANSTVSQRELSQKAGLSLGSVNILLKKMIKQGLIKMESIPANRVIYMLTPAGMAEKAFKTVRYIKVHYKVIEETKERISNSLKDLHQQYTTICILKPEDELQEILLQTVQEYKHENPKATIHLLDQTSQIAPGLISQDETVAFLALPENLVLDQVRQEYRKQITPISLMELF
jgi:DNA-binding MarR family transcriptional regulator